MGHSFFVMNRSIIVFYHLLEYALLGSIPIK